ncbi:05d0f8c1-b070-453a-86a2-aa0e66420756 [Thermothielavioides terrestris]
MDNH